MLPHLVFFRLWSSFDTSGDTFQSNALMIGLVGHVVLSACFLVRIGTGWDDARGLRILFARMGLANSVCFDDDLATDPSIIAWTCERRVPVHRSRQR